MARVLGLDDPPAKLRTELQNALRVCDEAVVLPSAVRSSESGAFKNIVFRLSGTDTDLNPDIFSPAWFSGVSAVMVPENIAEQVVRDPRKRAQVLSKLRECIPSEMANSDLQVGPELDGDSDDRDKTGWIAGFDSGSCCVGLYSARQSRSPEPGCFGMNRVHSAYYLVCKAGGGVAAQTFHSRLTASLRNGKTLDECFAAGGSPGPQALRRVSIAAQRMRKRILAEAATAFGFVALDTISDNAAAPAPPHRGCIPTIDVTYNCLRKVEGASRSTWQYSAGCVDVQCSQGLMTSSTRRRLCCIHVDHRRVPGAGAQRGVQCGALCDGAPQEQSRRRDKHGRTAPTSSGQGSHRVASPRRRVCDGAILVEEQGDCRRRRRCGTHGTTGAVGYARLGRAFGKLGPRAGVSRCKVIRMAPEIVCVAAMEPAKLRACVKKVQEAGKR